ncbi:MAG: terminase small subunit [Clostridiales bacterium]|jgi:phage terminase small subunit|nr:terminase small subunit [Clostridiales bacterium]
MKLTAKQQAWIDYYKQGKSAAEAARLAGYRGNNHDVIGAQNLVKLSEYIIDRDEVLEKPRIADMDEINKFWSDVMRNSEADLKDRLKASELRARSAGMFTDKVQVSGGLEAGFEKLDNIMKQIRGDTDE